jgi:hypothetical protein
MIITKYFNIFIEIYNYYRISFNFINQHIIIIFIIYIDYYIIIIITIKDVN